MGNSYSFNKSSQLFFLVGMGFGVSYSMTKINVLDWINTSIWAKFSRLVMAVSFYFSLKLFFLWLSQDSENNETEFYFYKALPMFLYGYIIFGPLILFQCKIGLITSLHENAHLMMSVVSSVSK